MVTYDEQAHLAPAAANNASSRDLEVILEMLPGNGSLLVQGPNFTTTPIPEEKLPPQFNQISMIKTVVLSLMFVVAFIGNTATLVQMVRMRRRKSTINTLILHLAIADLVVTFFCNVTDAVWSSTVQWYGGDWLCKVTKFMQVFGLYSSTYMVVIISLDRCFAILDPMSRNKAPKRVRIMIATAWILSAVFSLPQTYIFRVRRGPYKEDFYQCVTFGAYTEEWQEPLYMCLSILLLFLIPLVTMITAYMLIFFTIAKKSNDLQRESEGSGDTGDILSRGPVRGQLFRKAKVKSLQMTALIVIAFIVCWTPYYVLFIMSVFYDIHQTTSSKAVVWIFFFGMANSMVNPMIYGAFHVCKGKKRRPEVRFAGTSGYDAGAGLLCRAKKPANNGHQCAGEQAGAGAGSQGSRGSKMSSGAKIPYHHVTCCIEKSGDGKHQQYESKLIPAMR